MKLNLKRKVNQPIQKEDHFKSNQYNQLISTLQEKNQINILPPRFFSPKTNNNDIYFTKSFNNGSKKAKPKHYNNSSISNSSNSIHIESSLGKISNQFILEKCKYIPKNATKEIAKSEYLRTEPTPTSTANTTNIDSITNQNSYKKMIEIMMKRKFISSLKSIDVIKNKNTSSYQSTPPSKVLYHHNNTKDKSTFVLSADNNIDKDTDINRVGNIIAYKDLIQSNNQSDLNMNVLKKRYQDYPISIQFNKQMGFIKGYGVNTYKGLIKKDNEDRVSIIQNVPKPKNYKDNWPFCFLLGVYDGHCGKTCANYLKDHLLNCIIKDNSFPNDPINAIEQGFQKAEKAFLYEKCLKTNNSINNSTDLNNQLIDYSGSCAIVIVIIDKMCYIANLGDSRALVSIDKGDSYKVLSIEHSTNNANERRRIEMNGGTIYQTKLSLNQYIVQDDDNSKKKNSSRDQMLYGPDRILPGQLSVSRSIGDATSKLPQFGGKSNVIISQPSIISYEITSESDFIILGSDGIYERMTNKEIIDSAWLIKKNKNNSYSNCVDIIIKTCLERNALDNLTAVIIDLKPTLKNSINDAQLEIFNAYETINQKNWHRKQQKFPNGIKSPPHTVKKADKNKQIMAIDN